MIKKVLLVIFIVLSLTLISCSSEDAVNESLNETIDSEDDSDLVVDNSDENEELEELKSEEDEDEEEVVEEEKEEQVDITDTSNFLIEKRIGDYTHEKSSFKTDSFMDQMFDIYDAYYLYGKTEAIVSVLVPSEKFNVFEVFNESIESDYEFLESEDAGLFDYDVYFNPYENKYIWVSGKNLILIQNPIGLRIIDEYLEEYPVSELDGVYNGAVTLEFKEGEEKVIFFNSNQYILKVLSLDDEQIKFSVDGKITFFEPNEESIFENLLLEIKSVDFGNDKVSIAIEKEVYEYVSLTVALHETKSFSINNRAHSLKVVGVNSANSEVIVELDGKSRTFTLKEDHTMSGLNVKMTGMLINTIGEESALIDFEIWDN